MLTRSWTAQLLKMILRVSKRIHKLCSISSQLSTKGRWPWKSFLRVAKCSHGHDVPRLAIIL